MNNLCVKLRQPHGAMEAHVTTDHKVGGSNPSEVAFFYY